MDYDANIAIIMNNPETWRNSVETLYKNLEKILYFPPTNKARNYYLLGEVEIARYLVVGVITSNVHQITHHSTNGYHNLFMLATYNL